MPKSHPIPTLAALALTLLTATARPQSLPATTPALPNLPPNTPPPHWPVAQYRALLAPHDPTPEQKAQTTRLINDLTADDYPTRQRASKELATRGPDAFPGLRQAVANANSSYASLDHNPRACLMLRIAQNSIDTCDTISQ
ncbi:MAG TPA: hypothetical protein VHQ47_17600 [Phycisphaerae bacterium]|nr:hypothetical protein [Phycisphaerae bacterium]